MTVKKIVNEISMNNIQFLETFLQYPNCSTNQLKSKRVVNHHMIIFLNYLLLDEDEVFT